MKLVYITSLVTGSGGVARVLAQKLTALVAEKGYDIVVVSTNDVTDIPFYEFHPKIRFYFIRGSFKTIAAVVGFYAELKPFVNREKPNWVVVADNGFKAYAAPWFLSKHKVVLEVHGSKHFLFSSQQRSLKKKIGWRLVDFLAKRFHSIVLLNEATGVEWKHKNITVIPNFIGSDLVATPIPHSKSIIAIGRVVAEKGYVRMLQIFESIHAKHPDWSLHIFGDLKDVAFYNSLRAQPHESVYFYGESKAVFAEIEKADFLIHTSFHEGFSLVVAEALALGRPVVAFDVPFILNRLIQDESTGFLVKDGDVKQFEYRMLSLIEQPELLVEMGEKASVSLQAFDIKEVLKKWVCFFES